MAKSKKTKQHPSESVAELIESDPDLAATIADAPDPTQVSVAESIKAERVAAFERWRADNPRKTRPFEAFGVTWDLPAAPRVAFVTWLNEHRGVSLTELSAEEAATFVGLLVPEDILTVWSEMVEAEELGAAAMRYFLELTRGGLTKAA